MKPKPNPVGGSGAEEGRDSACTPKWLAELLGAYEINLDPCSNSRSNVMTVIRVYFEEGGDGLLEELGPGWYREDGLSLPECAGPRWPVFINPPYARGQVIRWVRHWMHTRFTFLLRWDPSTEWFSELFPRCTHVWFPDRRINFDPPPGVKFSSNPFPHALYMRDPPADRLSRLLEHGYLLIPLDGSTHRAQSATYDDHGTRAGSGDAREDAGDREGEAGGAAGAGGTDLDGRTREEGVRW